MNQKNQPAFTINAETRRRIANEIKEHPQGKKVLKILENAHEGLTPKQQETIKSFLSKYAIDATSVLLGGGKIRGDIAKTVIDLIGSQIFTPMITNYRSEFKVRANAEMITGQVKIYNTILGSPIKGIFKNVPLILKL